MQNHFYGYMKHLKNLLLLLLVASSAALFAQPVRSIYTNFNSTVPDNNTATGVTTSLVGSMQFTLIGSTTATFATGTNTGGGFNDTVTTDNSGYNTTTYPTQGTASGTAGLMINLPTTNLRAYTFSWAQRHSNTASRWVQLQYTINGTDWHNYTGTGTDTLGLYRAPNGDTWYQRTADFSGILKASDNANFAVRIVSVFEPGTSNYVAARSTSSYGGGTMRFDGIELTAIAKSAYTLQILHSSDGEASTSAADDMPNYAAIIDTLEDIAQNSVTLSSGDNYIPSPFLLSGEDPAMQAPLRATGATYYSGGANGLRAAIGRPDIACMNIMSFDATVFGNHEFDLGTPEVNSMIGVDIRSGGADKRWIGAQFPYLSANLDFSGDPNLAYLYRSQLLPDTAFRTSPTATNNTKAGISPWTIIERGGQKIGVVGATTTILAKISSPGLTKLKGPGAGIENMDSLAIILQPYIDTLRNVHGINKIIMLTHLQQINLEEQLAPKLRGVDIIIAGGSHTLAADLQDRLRAGDSRVREYPIVTKNKDNEHCVILNTTSEWKYVGRFIADFDANGLLLNQNWDSVVNGPYAADAAMVSHLWGDNNAFAPGTKGQLVKVICDSIKAVITKKDGNIFGKTNVWLEGQRQFGRTEETNLGNISSDANLWYAQQYDPAVRVSIKNGGGIRAAMGEVLAVGSNVTYNPPAANPLAGKQQGDISQLDIENSLRFNNILSVLSVSANGLHRLLEHGVAATAPGVTPGQFPQVGGVAFSFDQTKPAGSRIWSLVITNAAGQHLDTIVKKGVLYGDTARKIKIVTLNFLAGGGDGYPFLTYTSGRVDLNSVSGGAGNATFAAYGSEQDAFAEYLFNTHRTTQTAYNIAETPVQKDKRIQQLSFRNDSILFDKLTTFNLLTPANNARVETRPNNTTVNNITWQASTGATRYKFLLDLPAGNFAFPVYSVSIPGPVTALPLTSGQLDGLLAQFGIQPGDSITVKWTVVAYSAANDTLLANMPHNITLVRYPQLSNFFLLSPANYTQLVTSAGNTTPVNINWSKSSAATKYKFVLDVQNGNFFPGLFSSLSGNNGADTSLTLTVGQIDALLVANNIKTGSGIDLKWTVWAYNNLNDSVQAKQVFILGLYRAPGVGMEDIIANNGVVLYPNPAKGNVNVYFNGTAAEVSITDLSGKQVYNGTVTESNNTVSLAGISAGVYMVQVQTAQTTTVTRLIVK